MSETPHNYHPHRPLFNRPQNPALPTPAELARDLEAAELHAAGCTYQQIADRLGWKTRSGAYRAVWRGVGP